MGDTIKDTIKTRQIAFLIAGGVDANAVRKCKSGLEKQGAVVHYISDSMAPVVASDKTVFKPDHSLTSTASVCFDAVYVAAGKPSADKLNTVPAAHFFINEAYKHCKAVGFGKGTDALFNSSQVKKDLEDPALIIETGGNFISLFTDAIAGHRVWELEEARNNPS